MLLVIIIVFALVAAGPRPVQRTGPGTPAAVRKQTDAERRRDIRDREKAARLRNVVEQQRTIIEHYTALYDRTAARLDLIQSTADRERLEEKLFRIDQTIARAVLRLEDAETQLLNLPE